MSVTAACSIFIQRKRWIYILSARKKRMLCSFLKTGCLWNLIIFFIKRNKLLSQMIVALFIRSPTNNVTRFSRILQFWQGKAFSSRNISSHSQAKKIQHLAELMKLATILQDSEFTNVLNFTWLNTCIGNVTKLSLSVNVILFYILLCRYWKLFSTVLRAFGPKDKQVFWGIQILWS